MAFRTTPNWERSEVNRTRPGHGRSVEFDPKQAFDGASSCKRRSHNSLPHGFFDHSSLAWSVNGTVSPGASAVSRLMLISNFVGTGPEAPIILRIRRAPKYVGVVQAVRDNGPPSRAKAAENTKLK
jgi:hypothetical protein